MRRPALREESLLNLLGEKRPRYKREGGEGHVFVYVSSNTVETFIHGECGVTEAGRQLQSGYVSSKTFIHGECGVTEAGRQLQSGYVSSKTFIHGECGVTEAGRQLQSGYVSSKTFIHGECGVTEAGRQLQSGYVSSKTFIHGECGVTEAGRQLQSGFSLGHLLWSRGEHGSATREEEEEEMEEEMKKNDKNNNDRKRKRPVSFHTVLPSNTLFSTHALRPSPHLLFHTYSSKPIHTLDLFTFHICPPTPPPTPSSYTFLTHLRPTPVQ
ncbi:hypothetical protein O3P69_011825 [Scylla paramamosain]|uniref:Uncharacterized protein n=1 Tax=Scylla paramamosain TaxID=85552 RepID=A0AAW0SF77_SCYPA